MILALAVFLPMMVGCSSATAPWLDTEFQYGEVDDPSTIQEGINVTVGLGDLYILGHLVTPTRCYRLEHEFGRKAGRLELRIVARPTGAGTCDPLGGYRYTLAVFRLRSGTYELTVVHDITGAQGGQFTDSVTIR